MYSTHQQIVDAIEALNAERLERDRAITDEWKAKCAEVRMFCADIGHVYGKSNLYLGKGRQCMFCYALEPGAEPMSILFDASDWIAIDPASKAVA